MDIVIADIGGTHARFALAQLDGHKVLKLSNMAKLKTADYATLAMAWHAYADKIRAELSISLPRSTAIAIAGPVEGEVINFTNNSWVIKRSTLAKEIDVDDFILLNDFEAMAHAVAMLDDEYFSHVCGPITAPKLGVKTILGPGTGLGVAHLRITQDNYIVSETEGGHIDFAPIDSWEDALLADLRKQHRRVSVERVVSGPGLRVIYNLLTKGKPMIALEDKDLWALALGGDDENASAALDRFLLSLGSVAGDLALAHGANHLIITGGLGDRLADHIPSSGFVGRFAAKGRFQSKMQQITVQQLRYDEPGLFGAAAAYCKALFDSDR